MNDYYFQYIKEKKNQSVEKFLESLKVPTNSMLPQNASLLNINQLSPFPPRPGQQNQNFNMPPNDMFNMMRPPNVGFMHQMLRPQMVMPLMMNNGMNSMNPNISNQMINRRMPPLINPIQLGPNPIPLISKTPLI